MAAKDAPVAESMVDSSLHARKPTFAPKRRGLNFFKPGEITKKAKLERAKLKLQKDFNEVPLLLDEKKVEVPQIEWWDQVLLETDNYDNIPQVDELLTEKYSKIITDLVLHPKKFKAPNEPVKEITMKAYLTKKEQKKIRRQNRKDLQKEQAEKVRLGLMPPPEAKVKMSNLMRVLGSEAIQDPTKMEAHVKKQVDERLKKHEEENASRKLTKEEKSEKRNKKIAEDTSLSVHVAIYKIKSLQDHGKKFKVETNAKQQQMSALIVISENTTVVVTEGGPKQQKFYKNLMLNRLKWSEDEYLVKNPEGGEDTVERNECALVWEGQVLERSFQGVKCVYAENSKEGRDHFEKFKVPHYWDYVMNSSNMLSNIT
uniref:U4/U6 small nuclear ribonucleoprotein Prp3 n=1 Tax=Rhabditophanes sp. KR3021 TaxID=114890 RepID=A0AC35TGW7_9BILA